VGSLDEECLSDALLFSLALPAPRGAGYPRGKLRGYELSVAISARGETKGRNSRLERYTATFHYTSWCASGVGQTAPLLLAVLLRLLRLQRNISCRQPHSIPIAS
jgi:hypothetical protein